MAMIKCRNCGRNVSDSEKVCPYCEEKIEKKINCPKCGCEDLSFSIQSKTGVHKCDQCGYNFSLDKNGEAREVVGAREEKFNLFTAYISVFKKMFDFRGRSRRKEYWYAFIMNWIVTAIVFAVTLLPFYFDKIGLFLVAYIFLFVYSVPVAIAFLAAEVRRLHDTGRGWPAVFVSYSPVVGQYLLLIYLFEDSQFGPNEYGPNPKGQE